MGRRFSHDGVKSLIRALFKKAGLAILGKSQKGGNDERSEKGDRRRHRRKNLRTLIKKTFLKGEKFPRIQDFERYRKTAS